MLTVAVDLDGCCYPFTEVFARWWRERTGDEISDQPTVYDFWRDLGLSADDWVGVLDEFGDAHGYRSAAPYPDAAVGLNVLFDAGADLVGVSSRRPSRIVEADTYGWLSDWLVPFRAVSLGPSAKLEVECDLVVDDNPDELARIAEFGDAPVVLLARPWNEQAEGFVRVSWRELPVLVDEILLGIAGEPDSDRRFVIDDLLAARLSAE